MTNKMPIIKRETELTKFLQVYERRGQNKNDIVYCGNSGIGKTTFLHEIEKEMEDKSVVIYVDCAETVGSITSLLKLIADKMNEQLGENVFIRFEKSYKRLVEINEKHINLKDALLNDVAPDIMEYIGSVVWGPMLAKLGKYSVSTLKGFVLDEKNEKALTSEEVLILDFQQDISEMKQEAIIIIDSLEDVIQSNKQIEKWFREINLPMRNHNLFWIFTGQDKYPDSIEILPLETAQYETIFLEGLGIEGSILTTINDVSLGIPYILDYCYRMCVDGKYELFTNRNYFIETEKRLFVRYPTNYLKLLGILSNIGFWNDETITYIVTELRYNNIVHWNIECNWIDDYKEIKKLSFIKVENNKYTFYEKMRKFYSKLISCDDVREVQRYLIEYYGFLMMVGRQTIDEKKEVFFDLNKRIEDSCFLKELQSDAYKIIINYSYEILDFDIDLEIFEITYQCLKKFFLFEMKMEEPYEKVMNRMVSICDEHYLSETKKNLLAILRRFYEQYSVAAKVYVCTFIINEPRARYSTILYLDSRKELDNISRKIDGNDIKEFEKELQKLCMTEQFFLLSQCLPEIFWYDYHYQFTSIYEKYVELAYDVLKEQNKQVRYWVIYLDVINTILNGNKKDPLGYKVSNFRILEMLDLKYFEGDMLYSELMFQYAYTKHLLGEGDSAYKLYEEALELGIENKHHFVRACRSLIGLGMTKNKNDIPKYVMYIEELLKYRKYEISEKTACDYYIIKLAMLIMLYQSRDEKYYRELIGEATCIRPEFFNGLYEIPVPYLMPVFFALIQAFCEDGETAYAISWARWLITRNNACYHMIISKQYLVVNYLILLSNTCKILDVCKLDRDEIKIYRNRFYEIYNTTKKVYKDMPKRVKFYKEQLDCIKY